MLVMFAKSQLTEALLSTSICGIFMEFEIAGNVIEILC